MRQRKLGPYKWLILPLIILLWHVIAVLVGDPVKVPYPVSTLGSLISMLSSGKVAVHVLMSLKRMLIGYVIATVLGVGLGTLIALNKYAKRSLAPLLEILRPIPPLALMPILMVLMGIGETLPSVIVLKAALFPILLNTWSAVTDIDKVYEEAALTLEACSKTPTEWW